MVSAFEPRRLVLKGNGKGYRVVSIADYKINNNIVVIVGKTVRKTQGIMNLGSLRDVQKQFRLRY